MRDIPATMDCSMNLFYHFVSLTRIVALASVHFDICYAVVEKTLDTIHTFTTYYIKDVFQFLFSW